MKTLTVQNIFSCFARPLFWVGAFLSSSMIALSSGCASGGFYLTRQYAHFVNGQNVILRVVLYIFTSIVFAVTVLIDLVYFNTVDFWEGKVSSGTYEFKDADKTFVAHHEFNPGTGLKQSTIEAFDDHQKLIQTVTFKEVASGEIEMYVDGVLKSKVRDLTALPQISIYDTTGKLQEDYPLWSSKALLSAPTRLFEDSRAL